MHDDFLYGRGLYAVRGKRYTRPWGESSGGGEAGVWEEASRARLWNGNPGSSSVLCQSPKAQAARRRGGGSVGTGRGRVSEAAKQVERGPEGGRGFSIRNL